MKNKQVTKTRKKKCTNKVVCVNREMKACICQGKSRKPQVNKAVEKYLLHQLLLDLNYIS